MKKRTLNNRIWLKGLVVECPMGKPVADCPLNGLRSLPIPQLNKTVNELSEKTLKNFVDTHRTCYNHRVAAAKRPVL
jgi:hypothetical protein